MRFDGMQLPGGGYACRKGERIHYTLSPQFFQEFYAFVVEEVQ